MKVFISWSGEQSRIVAEALRDWLPDVIQAIEPFLSSHDIPKGARWGLELARELEGTSVGIICLTSENLTAPWILFESGALSKAMDEARICTFLFRLGPENLLPPLSDFQATKAEHDDTFKMLVSINNALGPQGLPYDKLHRAFGQWWDVLRKTLEEIPEAKEPVKQPSPEEMIQEIFRFIRSSATRPRAEGQSDSNLVQIEEDLLLGKWQVTSAGDPNFRAIWEFSRPDTVLETRKDGALNKGRWSFQPTYVHIAWDNGLWDHFNRPINQKHLRGDNWTQTPNCVIADKIG